MPLQGMAKLVVAQAQRHRRGALVEAVAPQRILEKPPLIVGNRGAEVIGRGRRRAGASWASAGSAVGVLTKDAAALSAVGAQGEWNGSNWISSI